jgi:predicted PurR-regulated permease PerM
MDLTILIVILLAGILIKYLIDIIKSLNDEIKEIKQKCIENNQANFQVNTKSPVEKFNSDLIKNIQYFRDYFDNQKTYK